MSTPLRQPRVTILDTGKANIASVSAALRRAGAVSYIANAPQGLCDAEYLVLPGVGCFGAAMRSLKQRALIDPVRKLILDGVPTLAICLGMQLLCISSEEDEGVAGLGIISGTIQSLPKSLRAPHLGWNLVEASQCRFVETGYAYFAHSFCLMTPSEGAVTSVTNYGDEFIASCEIGNILACQFHPELSGAWGAGLINRWLGQKEGLC
jgi:imidazole glycerol phosphate synthase glutamine amidotransferase subunit